jgi:cytochrome c peroxidase
MKIRTLVHASVVLLLLAGGPALADKYKPAPLTDADFHDNGAAGEAKAELGRLLMFDKVLSGNRNISCATCHWPVPVTGCRYRLVKGARDSA